MTRPLSRRTALGLAAALAPGLALAACGSGSSAPGGGSSASGGTRTVRHARGESTVPAGASRVVALDTDALDSVVSLGLGPVGATTVSEGASFPAYLPAERLAGTKAVDVIGQPSLEAIAALRPDLILSNQVRDDKRYEQLSRVAPTALSKTTGPTRKENVRLHAEAMGRQSEAGAADATYRTKLRDPVTTLGGPARAAATRVEMARFLAGAPTRLYLNDTFVGALLKDLGLGRPANQDKPGFSLEISPEQASSTRCTGPPLLVVVQRPRRQSRRWEDVPHLAARPPDAHREHGRRLQ
ncbi:ABC transporter substrate-binding protein [Kitasatospora sp. NPDC018058]|uniref:ABC transporter substrate-binding protein n=1 Tax=Kitasatospora sp. NPDC018058 TaxID=3364025 RepID=UPI0037C05250